MTQAPGSSSRPLSRVAPGSGRPRARAGSSESDRQSEEYGGPSVSVDGEPADQEPKAALQHHEVSRPTPRRPRRDNQQRRAGDDGIRDCRIGREISRRAVWFPHARRKRAPEAHHHQHSHFGDQQHNVSAARLSTASPACRRGTAIVCRGTAAHDTSREPADPAITAVPRVKRSAACRQQATSVPPAGLGRRAKEQQFSAAPSVCRP